MIGSVIYSDQWGEIIDRPDNDYTEIRWFDSTSEMTSDEYMRWVSVFAGKVSEKRRAGILVDAVQFSMPTESIDRGWINKQIIPKYNLAGIKKYAVILPCGIPQLGVNTEQENQASYVTAYFSLRTKALGWLSSLQRQ